MKQNIYIANLERLLIQLYDNHELTPNLLTCIMKEMSDCYINPDQTVGLESHDGKKFKELICFIMQPLTHQEIIDDYRRINEDDGRIWDNLRKAEDIFEYIWYSEFDMPDTEAAADARPIIPII